MGWRLSTPSPLPGPRTSGRRVPALARRIVASTLGGSRLFHTFTVQATHLAGNREFSPFRLRSAPGGHRHVARGGRARGDRRPPPSGGPQWVGRRESRAGRARRQQRGVITAPCAQIGSLLTEPAGMSGWPRSSRTLSAGRSAWPQRTRLPRTVTLTPMQARRRVRATRANASCGVTSTRVEGSFLESGQQALEGPPQHPVDHGALLADQGKHRAPSVPDLLVAAVAERAGLTVLHVDKDFDLIAEVTGQPVERPRLCE